MALRCIPGHQFHALQTFSWSPWPRVGSALQVADDGAGDEEEPHDANAIELDEEDALPSSRRKAQEKKTQKDKNRGMRWVGW